MALQAVETVDAVLYFADDPSNHDLTELHAEAARRGFSIEFEVPGPDPDGSKLREAMEGARAGGVITTILVPSGSSAGVKSPEAFLSKAGELGSEGFRLLALLEPRVDTNDPDFMWDVRWSTGLRKEGIRAGTTKWAKERKDSGARMGPMPKCGNCGHGVYRKGSKPGHLAMPGSIGPCFKPGCNCPVYKPRDAKLMGPSK